MDNTKQPPVVGLGVAAKPPEKAKPEAVKPKEVKFPIERLREKCRALFDVNESVFDGAMHGKQGEMTVEDAKSAIETWRKKKLVTGGRKDGGKL